MKGTATQRQRGEFVLPFDPDEATLEAAGGKGLNLAQLTSAGFPVPPGFIVGTAAYRAFVEANALEDFIARTVAQTRHDDPASLDAASQRIRASFGEGWVPAEVARELRAAYAELGEAAVAVRSSATAEDLPDLSFAGQQDSYLNVVGEDKLIAAVMDCWSSLWTARAIGYRARNGIPQNQVALAVVVQKMVPSDASGVLFTANPLSGKRSETVIDATLGLGEALVSGQVEPDHYVVDRVRGRITEKRLGAKATIIRSKAGGGTQTYEEDAAARPALSDAAILELAELGERAAGHFGSPQDIEWARLGDELLLLQSRPITSLYPLPNEASADPLQVFLSFGAVQGMLDPMTPLGQDTVKGIFARAAKLFGYHVSYQTQTVILSAGERLWINLTTPLRHPLGRRLVRRASAGLEPGAAQALEQVLGDPRLAPRRGRPRWAALWRAMRVIVPMLGRVAATLLRPDEHRRRVVMQAEALVKRLEAESTSAQSLSERLAFYDRVLEAAFGFALPRLMPRILAGLAPLLLLNRLASNLPGEATWTLEITRGLPHNVTTEMDMALWDVARTVKADPEAMRLFEGDPGAVAAAYQAGRLPPPVQARLEGFLQRYGMRGLAEIDLGRPRWRENPTAVLHILQSYIRIENPEQAPDAVFARGAAAAEVAAARLSERLRGTRAGWLKSRLAGWAARRVRALAGLRESPKFTIIRLLGLVRAGLLASGRDLVAAGVLERADDLFWLHRDELTALAARQARDWRALVDERRQRHEREKRRRQVPRLLLGDGRAYYEGLAGVAGKGEDVLVGSPVSAGVVEGSARVVFDPHQEQLEPGEILVCPGTDPAWTPLFLAAGGLVMEVGGLMTHGSVVAREYGIPAVVGVHEATTRLKTGQRLRVDGSSGRVTVLE